MAMSIFEAAVEVCPPRSLRNESGKREAEIIDESLYAELHRRAQSLLRREKRWTALEPADLLQDVFLRIARKPDRGLLQRFAALCGSRSYRDAACACRPDPLGKRRGAPVARAAGSGNTRVLDGSRRFPIAGSSPGARTFGVPLTQ